MKKLLLGLLFITLSAAAFAEELGPDTYAASMIRGEISDLYVFEDTNYIVQFKPGAEALIISTDGGYPLMSRAKDYRQFLIAGTAEQKKEMLALLMMAYAQGKIVRIRLNGTTSGDYNLIDYVQLPQ